MPHKFAKLLPALFVFFYSFVNVFAQNEGDDLQLVFKDNKKEDTIRFQAIHKFYKLNINAKPYEILDVVDYHLSLAETKKMPLEMAKALNFRGTVFAQQGNFKEALRNFERSANLASSSNGDMAFVAKVNGNIGNVYLYSNQYEKAIQNFFGALRIFKKKNDLTGQAIMYNNLGNIFTKIGEYDRAKEYLNKCIILNDEQGKSNQNGYSLLNLGYVSYELKRYEDAAANFEKALPKIQAINDKYTLSKNYLNLAEAYEKMEMDKKAFTCVEKSLAIDDELNNQITLVEQLMLIAKLTYKTNFEEALDKAEAIFNIITPETSHSSQQELYELMSKCYKDDGQMELSNKMKILSQAYKDSIRIDEDKYEMIRESVKNVNEVSPTNTEMESKEFEADKKDNSSNLTSIILTIALVLISVVVYYFIFRKK